MERIANKILYVVHEYVDPDHPSFNIVSVISYWSNGKMKKVINLHRDQRYSSTGKFLTKENCQKEGTVTAILVFGDNRELQFFLCRHKKKLDGNNRGPHLVDPEPWVFDLKHGTLFILHPEDEMLLDRFYHVGDRTFFRHGGHGVDRGRLSLGLVFRVSVHSHTVFSKTGRVKLSPKKKEMGERSPTFAASDEVLKKYVSSESKKERDSETTSLWLATEQKYFTN